MLKSFRNILLVAALAVSLLGLVGMLASGFYFFEKIASNRANESADAFAKQVFHSMYQVMKTGWGREELVEFSDGIRDSFADTAMTIHIYRGQLVDRDHGKMEQDSFSQLVWEAFETGEKVETRDSYRIRKIYPIKARSECLACHVSATPGDVLGVIEVVQDIEMMVKDTRGEFYLLVLLFAPIPLLVSFFVARLFTTRIDDSIEQFKQSVSQIGSVNDLKSINSAQMDMGIVELNRLYTEVEVLAGRMREIAADKELLEFEVKLLDKFIIASDVIKDWTEHVKELLIEINMVMEAYSLFVIFKVDEELYDMKIFWKGNPQPSTMQLFEKSAKDRIEENPYFTEHTDVTVNHYIADKEVDLPELSETDINLQTKSLILAKPRIGGVVGIGVQSNLGEDPTRYIVIESILTTLINVIGSVKAIYKYTKDLEYYATRDPLTNLYNQRMFRELIGYEIGRAKRHGYKFALFVIDLDNFKQINDTYGHDFGDRFLLDFAKTIKERLRGEDIICRYGGDEFVVILPECDLEQAHLIANKVIMGTENRVLGSDTGDEVRATASVGLSVYPDHGKDDKELFMVADSMMYKAKQRGKNQIAFPSAEDVAETFRAVEKKSQIVLRTLEKRQLIPFFQPVQRLSDDSVETHELFMRIEAEEKMYQAHEFIEVAERLGVIHRMDFILIEKAFEKMQQENYQGQLFINLSPKSLIIKEFTTDMLHLCGRYGIEPGRIIFEIMERDVMKNITLLEKFVAMLKYEGFQFAIDDFGSGFSSFHYMKRLPVDYIKIEGKIISTLLSDTKDQAFVKSILTISNELQIETIAEFVEDEAVRELLKAMGIDYAQGYHVGRPASDFYQPSV